MYLPSLWWHETLNIGEAFGLGYKATDFSFKELNLVKESSSYAQDLYVPWQSGFNEWAHCHFVRSFVQHADSSVCALGGCYARTGLAISQ